MERRADTGDVHNNNNNNNNNNVARGIIQRSLPPHGMKFVDVVLNGGGGGNESCFENFRMDKQVFYKLCDTLQSKGLLRHTNRIKIEEQLAIFLFIIGHNLRTRAVQELFRYSGETISRHFNHVLNSIMAISLECFEPPTYDLPPEISTDPRFYPSFKDCVGFVDCIHIPVTIGVDEQGPFRNKKGLLAQIVLAACSFDLKFNYVLAGWEGSALEPQVLHSAITRHNNLKVPEGKYYLVGDKYETIPGFIAPYQGVAYNSNNLPDGSYHPQDAKVLFNQRHSLLRSASERIFGALKERFPILTSAPPYPLQTQVKLVVAACALHNFIRKEKPDDLIFQKYEQDSVLLQNNKQGESLSPADLEEVPMINNAEALGIVFEPENLHQSSELRDSIAVDMWDDFIRGFASM